MKVRAKFSKNEWQILTDLSLHVLRSNRGKPALWLFAVPLRRDLKHGDNDSIRTLKTYQNWNYVHTDSKGLCGLILMQFQIFYWLDFNMNHFWMPFEIYQASIHSLNFDIVTKTLLLFLLFEGDLTLTIDKPFFHKIYLFKVQSKNESRFW